MCAPAILPALASVGSFLTSGAGIATLTAAAGATTAYGQIAAGKQQAAGLRYQSQLDEVNAINADRAARDALERGELDAVKHGREVAQLRGRQIASQAANNLELGFGSPLAILQDTDLLAAEDRAAIYENSQREADSYRISASNYRGSAVGNRVGAANAKSAAVLGAASTVLNTATQIGGTFKKYGTPKW